MHSAKAFSPAHITGFFTIQDALENPEQSGSLGAGFCILNGTVTKVRPLRRSNRTVVKINGQFSPAPVSVKTASLFFEAAGITPEPLSINHTVTAPQGSGFGTSGSGALSLAMALNKLYGFPLSEDKTAAVAHCADVLCKTGLGTVVGERKGGFELRLKAGTPPYGVIDGFCPGKPLFAVFICFGPLSTSDSLTDPKIRADINRYGNVHLQRLKENPVAEQFLREASLFSDSSGESRSFCLKNFITCFLIFNLERYAIKKQPASKIHKRMRLYPRLSLRSCCGRSHHLLLKIPL